MSTESNRFQVVVVGGGPAGIIAAVASARSGARTLLIEGAGFVGGVAAMGLPFQGVYTNAEEQIIKGIGGELIRRLMDMGAAADVRNVGEGPPRGKGSPKFNARWISYHPEALKFVALDMLHEAGVELLLHTSISKVTSDNGKVSAVLVQNKSGQREIAAECFVDSTGDGDIATLAGAPFEKGQADSLQPMTMTFTMSQVDLLRTVESGRAERLPHEIVAGSDLWRSPRFGSYEVDLKPDAAALAERFPDFAGILTEVNMKDLRDGVFHGGNMVHIPGLDGSDAEQLSKAEFDSRRLVFRLGHFLRDHVPGFEDAHMVSTSARIGVRETRRVLGDYYLTYEDVIGGRRFEDVVTLGGYRVDIHGYDGGPKYVEPGKGTQIKDFGSYDIPFRVMLPKNVDNVVVAGRCVSASHVAQGSLRVMGTAMGMGHAAGAAAALSARDRTPLRQVDLGQLQRVLLDQGAELGPAHRA